MNAIPECQPIYEGDDIATVEGLQDLIAKGYDPYSVALSLSIKYFEAGDVNEDPLSMYDFALGPRVLVGAVNFCTLETNGGITAIFQDSPELTKLSIDAMETLGFADVAANARECLGLFGLPEIFSWEDFEAANAIDGKIDEDALSRLDDEIIGSGFDEKLGDRLVAFIIKHRADFTA